MGILDKLKEAFPTVAGGVARAAADDDGELGREDLLRQTVKGILALRRHGARGVDEFPAAVLVHITVATGSIETLRRWTRDSAFEREMEARLLNELATPGDLPARRYDIAAGERDGIEVSEDAAPIWAVLVIDGGDRDKDRYPVEGARREWRLGRGPWHVDHRLPNDIILATEDRWVSRAAAILHRTGALFEVEAREQGEFLVVHPRDGTPKRPAMVPSGRVAVQIGDTLEFHDGADHHIRVHVREA